MSGRGKLAVAACTVIAIGVAAYLLPIGEWIVRFVAWVRGLGAAGALVYALVYAAGTVLLLPGTALTLGSGLLYGPLWGVVLVSPASVAGATLSFLLARYFLRGWVQRKLERYPRFAQAGRAVERHGFKMVLLMRLEPVFVPFALLNYMLGATPVRLRDYVLASWIGMLPATVAYVYIGSALTSFTDLLRGRLPESQGWHAYLFWSGLIVTLLLVGLLARIGRQALNRELAESAGECHAERE